MTAVPPRLLLLEADDDVRAIFAELLESEGYGVDAVANREEAERRLSERPYALVISDAATTSDDPWAALERLRALAEPGRVGLISGYKLKPEEVSARGFAFFLRKPLDIESLLGEVAANVRGATVTDEDRELVDAYYRALTDKDWAQLETLVSDDVRYHLPGSDPTFSKSVEGRERFLRFSEETFKLFADARFTVEEVFALPRGLVSRFRSQWTAPDGKPTESSGAVLLHTREGKICEIGVRMQLQDLVGALNRGGGAP